MFLPQRPLQSHVRGLCTFPLVLCVCAALLVSACSGPEETDANSLSSATATTTLVSAPDTGSVVLQADATATAEAATADEPQAGDDTQVPDAAVLDADGLVEEVGALVGGSGGFVEVVLATPEGGTLFAANEQEPLEAASLYKLAVMVEVFRQRDAGLISFEDLVVIDAGFLAEGEDAISSADIGAAYSIETLLFDMIDLSSNVAATALLWQVGTDNVNATVASLGLATTEIRWYPLAGGEEFSGAPDDTEDAPSDAGDGSETDDTPTEPQEDEPTSERAPSGNTVLLTAGAPALTAGAPVQADLRADASLNVTSAADVAALLGMLARGEVVSPESSAAMLTLLQDQVVNDRLPAYLPGDAVVAHKTGNLDALSHDAGIIYTPAGPVIVVVMTEDLDDEAANALMAEIGLSVWQHAGGE